jgi:cytochrome c
MASSLEVNKTLAAILTAGIIASGAGVVSRIIYSPHLPEENAYPIQVASAEGEGAEDGGAAAGPSFAALLASGSPEAGATVAKKCAACHNFEEGSANKIGPVLWGVVGRDIASVEGFAYSDALASHEGVWDYENLSHFIANPKGWAPGTKMAFAGLQKEEDLANVILYLRSISPAAPPLPEAEAETAAAGEQPAAADAAAAQQPVAEAEEEAPQDAGAEQPAAEREGQAAQDAGAGQETAAVQQETAAVQPETGQGGAQPAAAAQDGGGVATLLAAADPAAGEKAARKCAVCHSFEQGGAAKLGPPLWGVVGRDIASVEGFAYSDALASHEGVWDYDKLGAFLTDPKDWAPGTKMAFAGIRKKDELAAVIAYLRSLADNPEPLPEGG